MDFYVNRAAYAQALYINTRAIFEEAFGETPSNWQDVATRYDSSTREEEYPYLEPPDGMKEWIGDRATTHVVDRAFRVKNRSFATGVKINLDDVDDNRLVKYRPQIATVGREAALIWDELVALALAGGLTSTWLDGQYFFDSDHPVNIDDASLGTFANNFDATAQGGSAARDLTVANLLYGYQKMRTQKKPNGRPMVIRPTHLLVPPTLEDRADDILTRQFIAPTDGVFTGMSGAVQQQNPAEGKVKRITLDFLADDDAWYLAALELPMARPIGVQIRQDVIWEEVGPTPPAPGQGGVVSEQVYKTRVWEAGPRARGEAFLQWPWRIFRFSK